MPKTKVTHESHATNLPRTIFQHWGHSREEDAGGGEVYRPLGFAFPRSFGRDGFEIMPNGVFIQDDIGPADGIVQTRGHWRLEGPQQIAVSFPRSRRPGFAFEILSVDEAVLRIRRLRSAEPATEAAPRSVYAGLQGIDEGQLKAFAALPAAESCRRIDFERAEVVTLESFPPQYVLFVSGTKPYLNMEVDLVPLTYVRQPEYWGIEVVGCLRGIGIPALAPYRVSLRLTGFVGARGIEVLGARHSKQVDVPPPAVPSGVCTWEAWLDREPPGPSRLHIRGECEFPTPGYQVRLKRHEPQGFNPRDLLLDKEVRPPDGIVPQHVTRVEVRYEEETTAGFDTVTILPDGDTLPVRVVSRRSK